MKVIYASVNFDLFMLLPRSTARITRAAKLEFSSKHRSRKPGAGQAYPWFDEHNETIGSLIRSNRFDYIYRYIPWE
jgi:hypothetical protein